MQGWSLGWEDPLRREWQPTPLFLPGESHRQRSLVGTVHGAAKSQTQLSTERPSLVTSALKLFIVFSGFLWRQCCGHLCVVLLILFPFKSVWSVSETVWRGSHFSSHLGTIQKSFASVSEHRFGLALFLSLFFFSYLFSGSRDGKEDLQVHNIIWFDDVMEE